MPMPNNALESLNFTMKTRRNAMCEISCIALGRRKLALDCRIYGGSVETQMQAIMFSNAMTCANAVQAKNFGWA